MLRYSTYQSIYDRKSDSRDQGALRTIFSRWNEGLTNFMPNIFSKTSLIKAILFILLVVIAWAGMVTVVASSPGHANEKVETVVVKREDSLWKLAVTHKPGNMDTRIYVDAIKRANNLKGSNIQPGDILIMPMK
ncbi:LysM peptidoglycan-binding domain-containing protein [Paenibacillus lentus]|uniref:LysM peptidoglycan-binding domain-containing protein n=1 Tax=Paenibacillus lentus TaxID=1338368 RepID=A0A3Q8SCC8_9BACL|nr:LysM peptidoglycan-binding domain-containing protein [Paenibacillus lentus]AZK47369.1 LysM peptidoglycan-binding domain-containing protein [Paenibacillus lentus]